MALIWDSSIDASLPTSAQTVVLRKGPDVWMADFSQTEHAGFLRRTYGSAIMPLQWPISAPAVDVYTVIKARNPEYLIHVAN